MGNFLVAETFSIKCHDLTLQRHPSLPPELIAMRFIADSLDVAQGNGIPEHNKQAVPSRSPRRSTSEPPTRGSCLPHEKATESVPIWPRTVRLGNVCCLTATSSAQAQRRRSP